MPRRAKFKPVPDGKGWRINIPSASSDTGRRERKWFDSEAEALAWVDDFHRIECRPPPTNPPEFKRRASTYASTSKAIGAAQPELQPLEMLPSYQRVPPGAFPAGFSGRVAEAVWMLRPLGLDILDAAEMVIRARLGKSSEPIEGVLDRAYQTMEDLRILSHDGAEDSLRAIRDIGIQATRLLAEAACDISDGTPKANSLQRVLKASLCWPIEVLAFRDGRNQSMSRKLEKLDLGESIFVKVAQDPGSGRSRSINDGGGSAIALSIAVTLEREREIHSGSIDTHRFYKTLDEARKLSSKEDLTTHGYENWKILASQLPQFSRNEVVQRKWLEAALSFAEAKCGGNWQGFEQWKPEITNLMRNGKSAKSVLKQLLKAGLFQIAHPETAQRLD